MRVMIVEKIASAWLYRVRHSGVLVKHLPLTRNAIARLNVVFVLPPLRTPRRDRRDVQSEARAVLLRQQAKAVKPTARAGYVPDRSNNV